MGLRILVVDDHEPMRKILRNVIRQSGVASYIEEAASGADAIKKSKEGEFDVMILDWRMPGVDGLDVLKAIRSDPKTEKMAVIMVTAESAKEKVVEAIRAGVTDYVVKPFTPELLRKKIESTVRK